MRSQTGTAVAGAQPKLAGLDGLRAIAVLLVFLFHNSVLWCGWIGVQAFFVLSGFLITRVLYRAKGAPLGDYLREFYGRRSLRIFPIYFATLALLAFAVLAGLEIRGLKAGLPFALTYTYNWYHMSAGFDHTKVIAHFWTLCVEEQFYLFWPFVIFFCPESGLRRLLWAVVLLGPLLRTVTWFVIMAHPGEFFEPHIALYVATTSHLDAFALGGLASLYPFERVRPALLLAAVSTMLAGLAIMQWSPVPLGATSLGFPLGLEPAYGFIWVYSLLNLTSALLISCLVRRQVAPWLFDFGPLRYLGKISYGFYLLHYPAQSLVSKLLLPDGSLVLRMAVQFALTATLAGLSFHLIESRFSVLKDRWFPTHAASYGARGDGERRSLALRQYPRES